MKKFGTFTNLEIQPRPSGYYDRYSRDHGVSAPKQRGRRSYLLRQTIPGMFAGIGIAVLAFAFAKPVFLGVLGPIAGCNIKGNISINSRERIYHIPGQHYYDVTKISPQYGERYFCTEAEARKAGWRKSKV